MADVKIRGACLIASTLNQCEGSSGHCGAYFEFDESLQEQPSLHDRDLFLSTK